MATIRQRNGKFQVQVRIKGKRPVSGSFDTAAKAKTWARDQEARLRANVPVISIRDSNTTLREVIAKIRYAPTYEWAVKHFLSDPLSDMPVVAITREHVNDWLLRASERLAKATVSKYLNVPRMAWEYAQDALEMQMPRRNPFTRTTYKKEYKHRTRRLGPGEYERLIANMTQEFKDAVDWAIETGMRRGEIVNIGLSDFSNDYKFLLIPKTKTDTPRRIPLTRRAQEIVHTRLSKGTVTRDKLFPLGGRAYSYAMLTACRKAGIQDLTFHDLRHEALSRLNERGFSIYDMMTISGHKTTEMLKIYIQPDLERIYGRLNEVAA